MSLPPTAPSSEAPEDRDRNRVQHSQRGLGNEEDVRRPGVAPVVIVEIGPEKSRAVGDRHRDAEGVSLPPVGGVSFASWSQVAPL